MNVQQGVPANPITCFDERVCQLGESPLWHPLRRALYWVDIPKRRLLGRSDNELWEWRFEETISALAWVDESRLLVATEQGLLTLNLDTDKRLLICPLEESMSQNRSNDGRADPWGGFWVGTMGKEAEPERGAIYRWYRGELHRVEPGVTIPNGLCFDRSRARAYFADSARSQMYVLALDPGDGWPRGRPELFFDSSGLSLEPDGAVVDRDGALWVAMWDAGCIIQYSPEAEEIQRHPVPASRPTCLVFGGEKADDLYITTAALGVRGGSDGQTLLLSSAGRGLWEPAVMLN